MVWGEDFLGSFTFYLLGTLGWFGSFEGFFFYFPIHARMVFLYLIFVVLLLNAAQGMGLHGACDFFGLAL